MLQFAFAVACGCGVFLLAGATRYRGWILPDQVCTLGAALCDNPGSIAAFGLAMVAVAAVHRIVQN